MYPTADQIVKDVFYFSRLNVITTTIMSSHIQKVPSLGVARKIQGTLWVWITSSKTKKTKTGNPSQTWKEKMEPQPAAHTGRGFKSSLVYGRVHTWCLGLGQSTALYSLLSSPFKMASDRAKWMTMNTVAYWALKV